jgi:hypothetical protein
LNESAAEPAPPVVARVQARVLSLQMVVIGIMFVAILVLTAYAVTLGPLVGPGIEESFGLALALMCLCGALIVHEVDWTYRAWPLGRTVRPGFPGYVTDQGMVTLLKIVVVAVAAGGVAYILILLVT